LAFTRSGVETNRTLQKTSSQASSAIAYSQPIASLSTNAVTNIIPSQCSTAPTFQVSKCENIQDHMPLLFCGRDYLLLSRNTWLQLPKSFSAVQGTAGSQVEFTIHSCTKENAAPSLEQNQLCTQISNHTIFKDAPCPEQFIPSQLFLWARAIGPVIVAAHVQLNQSISPTESVYRVRFIPPVHGHYEIEVKHYWLGGSLERPSLVRDLPANIERQTYDRCTCQLITFRLLFLCLLLLLLLL
jgi:hypothetical protein